MKRIIMLLLLSVIIKGINAQGIYNNDARIISTSGSYWVFDNDDFTFTSESASQLAQLDNVVITDDASLTLTDATCLNISGNITVSSGGNITLNSGATSTASLIVSGTASGTAVTQRYLTGNAWHIVSSPSSGQAISDFLSANTNIPSKDVSGTIYRGMMDYDETINNWNTFFTSAQEGSLTSGKGFSLRTDSDGAVTFTGTISTGTVNTTVARTDNYGWNCVGNPYTSTIFINNAADADNNFIDLNAANLDESYGAVYAWEDGSGAYTIVSLDDAEAFYAQVGQGFFVKVKTGATQIQFTTSMQTYQPDATFKSGTIALPELMLTASIGEQNRMTRIKFNDETTTGLDFGYDAGVFKTGFDVYTQLLEDNGVDFGLQSLPETGMEAYEIPVGIDVATEGEITFSLKSENLPSGIVPVLKDQQTGVSFPFNTEEDIYPATIEAAQGYGRFTLTFSSTTDVDDILNSQSQFRAWYTNGVITVSGDFKGEGEVTVYDIQGRKLVQRPLTTSNTNRIEAPKTASGFYLVKVKDEARSEVLKVVKAGY